MLATGIGQTLGDPVREFTATSYWVKMVLALSSVVGTLGVARISHETLPLTWIAFGVSVITGVLMFSASAQTYVDNTAFQLKALALCGAGLNMALFQLVTARRTAAWDQCVPAPRAVRVAGLASVLLWAAVVLLGRWIGFTKGYDFTIPPGVELGFPVGPE